VRSPFAVGKYHVTRAEYARFVAATGRTGDGCETWTERDQGKSWRDPGFPQTERDPVVCVSWDDAKAYAAWLSQTTGKAYRLLNEAEWEYAARAGTTTARYWGNAVNAMCGYANGPDLSLKEKFPEKFLNASYVGVAQCRDGYVFTSPVGSFKPNAFGLYDMLGNAVQWTEDCWDESYANGPNDSSVALATGDCRHRVVRGGSWNGLPMVLRSGSRDSIGSGGRNFSAGFRVTRTQ
jgi:formylglycine-generating enzyme